VLGGDDDDEVPDLVENFDEASKNETNEKAGGNFEGSNFFGRLFQGQI